ncbi:MAG: methylated-DNA--[protein]-cysteine S-methyltransferase [Prevotellaceae bacterium]|jgi:methylated-DNA-[protein]-cysteine S-methyltransferase|nr:methylated-DNA--[protein]-cysteine S-methyltransferase [Prevotellaceae bacterium]
MFYYTHKTSIGRLQVFAESEYITGISFFERKTQNAIEKETFLIRQMYSELEEYFNGKRKSFEVPLKPSGTSFQQSVWKALQEIPYGETRSYKQIAEMIGKPAACRAVGMANNRNPIPIVIPCHRVVGTNGDLTGYAGGLDIKRKLLEIEKG